MQVHIKIRDAKVKEILNNSSQDENNTKNKKLSLKIEKLLKTTQY